MTAPGLTLSLARDVCRARCAAEGCLLVTPPDPRRDLVCLAVAAVGTWPLDAVQSGVSVTLPGDGGLLDALAEIPGLPPGVGAALALAGRAWGVGRPQVYLSPAAWGDPVALCSTVAHELAHVRQLYDAGQAPLGTLRWCLGYAGAPELRAAAEAQGYTQTVAALVVLGGWTPEAATAGARESLAGYRLGEADMTLADATLEVCRRSLEADAAVGGPVLELVRGLASAGVTVPREWLP